MISVAYQLLFSYYHFLVEDLFHFVFFQAFGIGYKKLHPDGQVRVHADDAKPVIRVKATATSKYQRFGFVESVMSLDPVGTLGLLASDHKVFGSILLLLRRVVVDYVLCSFLY